MPRIRHKVLFLPIITMAMGAATLAPAQNAAQSASQNQYHTVYDAFDNSDIVDMLHRQDIAGLNYHGAKAFMIVEGLVKAIHAENAYWRYGADMEARLDASLPILIEHIRITHPEFALGIAMPAIEESVTQLAGCSLGSLNAPKPTWADLLSDYSCLAGGATAGSKGIKLLQSSANLDGRRLTLLAVEDPYTFLEIYAGIQVYVKNLEANS